MKVETSFPLLLTPDPVLIPPTDRIHLSPSSSSQIPYRSHRPTEFITPPPHPRSRIDPTNRPVLFTGSTDKLFDYSSVLSAELPIYRAHKASAFYLAEWPTDRIHHPPRLQIQGRLSILRTDQILSNGSTYKFFSLRSSHDADSPTDRMIREHKALVFSSNQPSDLQTDRPTDRLTH